MRDWLFIILLGILAAALAGTAAFFSITGLAKLIAGASLAVIIMASVLEAVKLAVASYLHQYWKKVKWIFKIYLIVSILILMVITSVGIYGFLSNGYSKTSVDLGKMNKEIALIESKKEQKTNEIARFDEDIENKRTRIEDLSSVRKQQETRLDSLYQKGWYRSAKETENIIKKADDDIAILYVEIDSITNKIQRANKEVSDFEIEIMEMNNNDVVGDVGPLKYISTITGLPMDNIVNYLILMLMFVFDPMAVSLVIIINSIISDRRNRLKIESPISPTNPPIEKKKKKFIPRSYGMKKHKEEPKEDDIVVLKNLSQEKKTQYLKLLEILYNKGENKNGDSIPSFIEFITNINKENISITEKEVRDFLIVCNLIGIIKVQGKERKFEKDFQEASSVIGLIN